MENSKMITSDDIKVDLEDYNVGASTVMQEMEASFVGSIIIMTRP